MSILHHHARAYVLNRNWRHMCHALAPTPPGRGIKSRGLTWGNRGAFLNFQGPPVLGGGQNDRPRRSRVFAKSEGARQ